MDFKSFKSKIDDKFPNNNKTCEKCSINDKSKAKDARNKKRFVKRMIKRYNYS